MRIQLATQSTNKTLPEKYFFWYFPAPKKLNSSKLVVWLNGGPGCSSMEGLWTENGPFAFNDNGNMTSNPNSWHLQANLLFIEQPVGTGFSTDESSSEFDLLALAQSFYAFLDNFVQVFKDTKNMDLLLNAVVWSDGTPIQLKGIAMGNPQMDKSIQSDPAAAVSDFDFFNDAGFFKGDNSSDIKKQAAALADECRNLTMEQALQLSHNCYLAALLGPWYTATHTELGVGSTCFDPYHIDFQYPCGNVFNDHGYVKEGYMSDYLNTLEVQRAIHAIPQTSDEKIEWSECNSVQLNANANAPSATLLDRIISAQVNVLIYVGDRDSVCNYVGVERVLGNMTWGGAKGFNPTIASQPWILNASSAGMMRRERGLTYVRLFGSGHMVPADSPVAASALLAMLLSGSSNGGDSIQMPSGSKGGRRSLAECAAFLMVFVILVFS
ncbi:Cell death protease [Chytriomyces hyalinus]|nr:Cell death protease [Chytriomyces hyalinus]